MKYDQMNYTAHANKQPYHAKHKCGNLNIITGGNSFSNGEITRNWLANSICGNWTPKQILEVYIQFSCLTLYKTSSLVEIWYVVN